MLLLAPEDRATLLRRGRAPWHTSTHNHRRLVPCLSRQRSTSKTGGHASGPFVAVTLTPLGIYRLPRGAWAPLSLGHKQRLCLCLRTTGDAIQAPKPPAAGPILRGGDWWNDRLSLPAVPLRAGLTPPDPTAPASHLAPASQIAFIARLPCSLMERASIARAFEPPPAGRMPWHGLRQTAVLLGCSRRLGLQVPLLLLSLMIRTPATNLSARVPVVVDQHLHLPRPRAPPLATAEGEQTRPLGVCCFTAETVEELCRGNGGVQKWEQGPGA